MPTVKPDTPMGPGYFIFFRQEYSTPDTDRGLSGGLGAAGQKARGKRRRIEEENERVLKMCQDGFVEMLKTLFD